MCQNFLPFFIIILKNTYLLASGLSCSIRDLVPWAGNEPGSPALGAWSHSQWTTKKVPFLPLQDWIIFHWMYLALPEKAMAPHASTLAWKIPWAEEPGRLQSMGSQRVGHDWATSLSLFTFMHWRRKWQPTPVFLPGHNWSDLAAAAAAAAAALPGLIPSVHTADYSLTTKLCLVYSATWWSIRGIPCPSVS